MKTQKTHPRAFTLVELLVVVSLMGLLMAILLPAVQSAREASRRTVCTNHARQVALATLSFADAQHGVLPAPWRSHRAAPWDNFSWRVTLLPFLEHQALYDHLRLGQNPMDEPNQPLIQQHVSVFHCPSSPDTPRTIRQLGRSEELHSGLNVGAHDFVAIFNVLSSRPGGDGFIPYRGAWHGGRHLNVPNVGFGDIPLDQESALLRAKRSKLRYVVDGLSKTALISEQAGKPMRLGSNPEVESHPPSEGAWATCDYGSFWGNGINTHNFRDPYGFHGGAMIALCDGSVTLLPELMPTEIMVSLFTRDGNEILAATDWRR